MDGQSASSPDTDRQEHERREIAALTERLTSRYSTLPASVVEAAVRTRTACATPASGTTS
ncbi:hypothetical protein GO001_32850 [Streptomyces sp. NRRL B-1677]|uniref:three-helix bundle dimerization domain-containing protein n=1 Tax=Streptomyces sp. NRRL B-1677 TaxID=2682966 RepID=UPI00383FB02F|nr:hypothetical protein [Streptomyces sp. NRRL B-1677]